MTTQLDQSAATLNRALSLFGVVGDAAVDATAVIVPAVTLKLLRAKLQLVDSGARLPFVKALIGKTSNVGLKLRGDQAMQLARALEDIATAKHAREKGRKPTEGSPQYEQMKRQYPHLFR